jgi:hypothetical protein
VSGRRKEAQDVLKQLRELHSKQIVSAQYVAELYLGLGDKESALAYLENHPQELLRGLLSIDRHFDSLRDAPRFQALLARHGAQQ